MTLATGSRSSRSTSDPRGLVLPTFGTPRRPDRYSDGENFAEFMRLLGRPLRPTQRLIADVGLERRAGPDSPWAYSVVDAIVGRRMGKTVLELGVPLWRGVVLGDVTLPTGKVVPFRGAHTAQNLTAARRRFFADHVEPLRQLLAESEWSSRINEVLSVNEPSLAIDLHPRTPDHSPDGRHQHSQKTTVVPPTYDGVRGEGYLHLSFDEVLTVSSSLGPLLMSAARPTMAEFFGYAQMWRMSNIGTFSDDRTWLRQIRDRGRKAVERDTGHGQAYFEWSVPEDADIDDEAVWWKYYPPLSDGSVGIDQLR